MAEEGSTRQVAGLFDIRNIIGALLGIYGVVLIIVGLTSSSSTDPGRAGTEADLWVGLALVVVGVFFIGWARLRPIVVDEQELEADKAAVDEGADRGSGAAD